MNTVNALKELSDLDLILKYQKSKKNTLPQLILLKRHQGLVYRYAFKLYNELKKDYSISLEDIIQDFREQLFQAFDHVDINKIKNKERFNSLSIILYRFNAYVVVIKNRYNKLSLDSYEASTMKEDIDGYQGLPVYFNVNSKKFFAQDFTHIIFLEEFGKNLCEKEKKYWNFFIKGYKVSEISKELRFSATYVYDFRKVIKNKYIKFFDIKK